MSRSISAGTAIDNGTSAAPSLVAKSDPKRDAVLHYLLGRQPRWLVDV